jgi:hypothetical protein
MRTYKTVRTTTVDYAPASEPLPPARRARRKAAEAPAATRTPPFRLGQRVAVLVELIAKTAPDEYEVHIVGAPADSTNVMLASDLALGWRI